MPAITAALALVSSAALVPVFEVMDGDLTIGSAFLAVLSDPLGDRVPTGSLVLVTAAHVVAPKEGALGRNPIDVRTVDCGPGAPLRPFRTTIGRSAVVLVWPGLDLAAIPFPQPGHIVPEPDEAVLGDFAARAARLEPPARLGSAWPPDHGSWLEVIGFHAANVCGRNPALFLSTPTWRQEADGLMSRIDRQGATELQRKLQRLRFCGTMSDDASLIQYWSPAGPGASGGPVTMQDDPLRTSADGRPRVIGVHVGGAEIRDSGWAVAFPAALSGWSETRLGAKPIAWPECLAEPADATQWPCYRAPSYRNSLEGAPTPVRLMAARSAPGALAFSASFGSDVGWRSANSDLLANGTVRVGVAIDYARPAPLHALGARLVGGHRWAKYTRSYVAPDGRTVEVVTVDERAWLLEFWPVEWSFLRSSKFWPTLGAGVRFALRDPLAISVPLHLRLSAWSLLPAVALTVDFSSALELDRDLTRRYRLVGGGLDSARWTSGLSLGAAVGLEYIW